jgi:hypothetical protein
MDLCTGEQEIVIRSAMTMLPGSVRLNVVRKAEYDETRGSSQGVWFEWKSAKGREFFLRAGVANRGGNKKVAIPAMAVLGGEEISDVRILWDRDFRLKRHLLALFVMEA